MAAPCISRSSIRAAPGSSSSTTTISADLGADCAHRSTRLLPKRQHIVAELDHSAFGYPAHALRVFNEETLEYDEPIAFKRCTLDMLRAFELQPRVVDGADKFEVFPKIMELKDLSLMNEKERAGLRESRVNDGLLHLHRLIAKREEQERRRIVKAARLLKVPEEPTGLVHAAPPTSNTPSSELKPRRLTRDLTAKALTKRFGGEKRGKVQDPSQPAPKRTKGAPKEDAEVTSSPRTPSRAVLGPLPVCTNGTVVFANGRPVAVSRAGAAPRCQVLSPSSAPPLPQEALVKPDATAGELESKPNLTDPRTPAELRKLKISCPDCLTGHLVVVKRDGKGLGCDNQVKTFNGLTRKISFLPGSCTTRIGPPTAEVLQGIERSVGYNGLDNVSLSRVLGMIRRNPLTCQDCETGTLSYVVRSKDGGVEAIKCTNFTYTLKSPSKSEKSFEGCSTSVNLNAAYLLSKFYKSE
eukprot:TRINITY_DN18483_c0_g1_i1.p1 TRINITY_DN18483_c0_g1~~TRINITY_DN18483_c0_g1_i1.p1  ORF type:complete len:468 (-),score=66.64 TRINITY_DN18483_c0_g1_i1:281-1684(-)